MNDAPQVDAENPAPVLLGHLPDGPTDPDARVVVHEVHRTEALEGGVAQRLHRGPVGDVGDHAEDLGPRAGQVVDRQLQRPCLNVAEDDPHALGGGLVGHGPADAAGAAGDHRHLALQVFHWVPSPCSARLPPCRRSQPRPSQPRPAAPGRFRPLRRPAPAQMVGPGGRDGDQPGRPGPVCPHRGSHGRWPPPTRAGGARCPPRLHDLVVGPGVGPIHSSRSRMRASTASGTGPLSRRVRATRRSRPGPGPGCPRSTAASAPPRVPGAHGTVGPGVAAPGQDDPGDQGLARGRRPPDDADVGGPADAGTAGCRRRGCRRPPRW